MAQIGSQSFSSSARPLPRRLQTVLGISEDVELSQIELIYRAEGNANLVLALPQFHKVLRLPKVPIPHSTNEQQQAQQPEQTNTSGHRDQQNSNATTPTMEDFAAYIGIIRCLMGNEFIFETAIVDLPNASDRQWIDQHIQPVRPAHRLNTGCCGRFGLLLPDATRLPKTFDIPAPNPQPQSSGNVTGIAPAASLSTRDTATYAVEIKPKQGWLLPHDVNSLFDMKPTTGTTTTQTVLPSPLPSLSPSSSADVDLRCRYCVMQFLKLQQQKIGQRSHYCPLELFSGEPVRMLAALRALYECPQNNLRIFRDGVLIFDEHLCKTTKVTDIFPGSKMELISHLLVTCLLRDYTELSCASGGAADAGRCVENDVDTDIAGQSHSSATSCAPRKPNQCCELNPKTEANTMGLAEEVATEESVTSRAQVDEAEMLCLPKNCVLQTILHLQLLVKRHLHYMLENGLHRKQDKSYHTLKVLLERCRGNAERISLERLDAKEQFLLGATALDCSIMIAFRQIHPKDELSGACPYVVDLPAYKSRFVTKITILDLDPKPDSHFHKYCRQTREALNLCGMK